MVKKRGSKHPMKKDCMATVNTINNLRDKQANFEQDCLKHDSLETCKSASEANYGSQIEEEKTKLSGCPQKFKHV